MVEKIYKGYGKMYVFQIKVLKFYNEHCILIKKVCLSLMVKYVNTTNSVYLLIVKQRFLCLVRES